MTAEDGGRRERRRLQLAAELSSCSDHAVVQSSTGADGTVFGQVLRLDSFHNRVGGARVCLQQTVAETEVCSQFTDVAFATVSAAGVVGGTIYRNVTQNTTMDGNPWCLADVPANTVITLVKMVPESNTDGFSGHENPNAHDTSTNEDGSNTNTPPETPTTPEDNNDDDDDDNDNGGDGGDGGSAIDNWSGPAVPDNHSECTDDLACHNDGIALVPAEGDNVSGVCFCWCLQGFEGTHCEQVADIVQQASPAQTTEASLSATLVVAVVAMAM